MRKTKKAMLILDEMPECCYECHLRHVSETISLSAYTYQDLIRCKFEPEGLSEDEGDEIFLNDFMWERRPCWCPLKEVEDDVDGTRC